MEIEIFRQDKSLIFSYLHVGKNIRFFIFFFKSSPKSQIHYSRSGGRIGRIFHNNFFSLTLYFLEGFDVLSLMSSVTTLFYMGGLCKSITWWKQPWRRFWSFIYQVAWCAWPFQSLLILRCQNLVMYQMEAPSILL